MSVKVAFLASNSGMRICLENLIILLFNFLKYRLCIHCFFAVSALRPSLPGCNSVFLFMDSLYLLYSESTIKIEQDFLDI